MRFVLAVAALAALTLSANAEPTYVQGGPVQQGKMCNISTSGGDGYYGYVVPCAPVAKASKKRKS
jgi:hypothetical protein